MKTEGSKMLCQIQDKVKNHKEQSLENKLSDINDAKGNVEVFKSIKKLNREQHENPSIHDKKMNQLQTNKRYTILYRHIFQITFFDK